MACPKRPGLYDPRNERSCAFFSSPTHGTKSHDISARLAYPSIGPIARGRVHPLGGDGAGCPQSYARCAADVCARKQGLTPPPSRHRTLRRRHVAFCRWRRGSRDAWRSIKVGPLHARRRTVADRLAAMCRPTPRAQAPASSTRPGIRQASRRLQTPNRRSGCLRTQNPGRGRQAGPK